VRLNEYLDEASGDRLVCGCGCGYGSRIEHWGSYSLVAEMQFQIRQRAKAPVFCLSGARCPRHNALVAKSERSQHSICQALDLALPSGWKLDDFYTLCVEVVNRMTEGRGGVGFYRAENFVHIDTGMNETSGRRWGR
jgi:uncharacterized protein YcbK (DUF882 family)